MTKTTTTTTTSQELFAGCTQSCRTPCMRPASLLQVIQRVMNWWTMHKTSEHNVCIAQKIMHRNMDRSKKLLARLGEANEIAGLRMKWMKNRKRKWRKTKNSKRKWKKTMKVKRVIYQNLMTLLIQPLSIFEPPTSASAWLHWSKPSRWLCRRWRRFVVDIVVIIIVIVYQL